MFLNRVSSFGRMAIIVGFMLTALPATGAVKMPQQTDRVAIVNGTLIDRTEFDGEVLRVEKALLQVGKPLTCSQVSSIRTEVIEALIRREILYQESRKSGIRPDEDAVNKEMKTLRQQFSADAEYRDSLKRQNVSEEILRSRMERNSSIQQYVAGFASKVKVTDDEMVSYYQGHLDAFRQPLQVRVSHIFIQTDPKWQPSRKQEARRKVEQILKDLKKGQDFAALAREQSDGPTRTNGGELGYVRTGQLDKQFESKVFALKAGEITDIIETDYGFHLFKVADRKPETVLAYENVKEKIGQFLREEKAKQEADSEARTLRKTASVEILLDKDSKQASK